MHQKLYNMFERFAHYFLNTFLQITHVLIAVGIYISK